MIWVKSSEINFARPLCSVNITILIGQLIRKNVLEVIMKDWWETDKLT